MCISGCNSDEKCFCLRDEEPHVVALAHTWVYILWNMLMWSFHIPRISVFTVILVSSACENTTLLTFETTGADQMRSLAIVTLDTNLKAGDYTAQDHTGKNVPFQVDHQGRGTLLMVRALPGAVTRWTVSPATQEASSVTAYRVDSQILFNIEGRKVVAYQFSKRKLPRTNIPEIYHRDGYLHPVWTPRGRIITDDYPPDHIHHHGVWAAWTNTIFQGRKPDFWNMGEATGRVEVSSLDSMWSGSVHAGLKASHRYVDMTTSEEVAALHESWHMEVYGASSKLNILDLTLTQLAATNSSFVLQEHRYGGVGFRGHRDWSGERGAEFFTSEGRTRENGHATRAHWCHIGGRIDGDDAGITILSHPENHEAPQPMRIHPTEPFFNFAPTQAGTFTINPDKPVVWKYRFVTYDGAHDQDLLDALWDDYANPLTVEIIHQSVQ